MSPLRRLAGTDWAGLLVLCVLGAVALAVLRPNFVSGFNLYVLLVAFAITALPAFAQMVILGIGQMNLAIGAVGGLAAVCFAGAMQVWGLPWPVAALIGLGVGIAGGLINGVLIVGSGISAFIVTLATLYVFKGINLGLTEAQPFYGLDAAVKAFGNASIGPLPWLLLVPLVVAALLALLLRRTVPGRQILAVGGNAHAAVLSGISVPRTVMTAHAISGLLAAIGGMLAAARLQAGQPSIGDDWLIMSFAAPILGGAVLSGGHVSVAGTCLGVLLVALLSNALVLLQIDPYWVQLVLGLLILAAVVLNRWRELRASSADQEIRGVSAALEIEGAVKTFPGVRALDGVAFRAQSGSIHALLGENGAGKSTLIKIIAGVHRPDSGTMRLSGQEVAFASPRELIAAGISVVHQERNLIPRFSIAENIALERLPTRGFLLDRAAMEAAASVWLKALDLDVDPSTPVAELGPARMQLVEIAKALSLDAKILLLDEPTASLTPHESERLFTILRRLRDQGRALVFVSHKLDEVFELCDRVTVLRDGKNVCADERLAGLDRAQVVKMMVGREERLVTSAARAGAFKPALQLDGVGTALGHRDVSLTLHAGEVLGLYGLVGAGRTELAKAIMGLVPITSGRVLVQGKPARIGSPTDALAQHRIGYVSEDRKQEGLILAHDVQRNVAVTIWPRLAGFLGLLGDKGERSAVAPFVERLRVRTPSLRQRVGNLSGGNQQKVSVAKWLAADADILIIDEPTVGIDVDTKAYLHELILELAGAGKAILLISSDMPEMVALADRILVMGGFRVLGAIDNDRRYETTSGRIMSLIHASEAA